MAPNPTLLNGYLEEDYLDEEYLGGDALWATPMQVNLVIETKKDIGQQVERNIVDFEKHVGQQVERNIIDFEKYTGQQTNLVIEYEKYLAQQVERVIESDKSIAQQVERIINFETYSAQQVERNIVDFESYIGQQVELVVQDEKATAMQILRLVNDFPNSNAMQVARSILDILKPNGMEVRRDKSWPHINCNEAGYLNQDYLSQTYLGNYFCVHGSMQVERFINEEHFIAQQVERFIDASKSIASQVLRNIVDFEDANAMQVERLKGVAIASQILRVLYNTNRLRVLCEFPSRGTTGTNWTATSTKAGDFDVNNLNTDIVEQVWRSNNDTSVILTCDTEVVQGILIDTIGILNHNLTSSASVSFQGSNVSDFSAIGITIPLEATEENIYYIAETFPTAQYRYWRIVINDVTNPYGYLQIGTIVFGTTVILQGECFVDELVRRTKHFSDKVQTEGFTNVSNDRTIKYSTSLEFRSMRYDRGNFENLQEVFKFARTSLKCLWIPDPQDPARFAVFGKLTQIPDVQHKNMGGGAADLVSFGIEVDESL